jgi:ferric-dicitrate binding protein FerR (iron transport regulator)
MKSAAILLVPLLIAGGVVYNYLVKPGRALTDQQVLSTIYAPLGARVSFTLPDGTTGMLNSGSRLSYSLPFNTNRRVKIEGEGWFEVKRDENHPFEIGAGSSTIKVLGTSFNLSAYPSESYVEIVLKHGSVEFQENESNGKTPVFPSERLIFQNGNISKSVTDPAKYNAWTEGKLVFRGDPMAEVARRLERWFGVKVELGDKELEKYSFRATFQDDKLEDVLRFLSLTSPIRYKITPRKIHVDGTFEKELVTIYLRKS